MQQCPVCKFDVVGEGWSRISDPLNPIMHIECADDLLDSMVACYFHGEEVGRRAAEVFFVAAQLTAAPPAEQPMLEGFAV